MVDLNIAIAEEDAFEVTFTGAVQGSGLRCCDCVNDLAAVCDNVVHLALLGL